MSLGNLLQSLQAFLRSERLIDKAYPDPDVRKLLMAQRDKAVDKLSEQFDAFQKLYEGAGSFRRILVAVDESRQANWALKTAAGLAAELSARLTLVHAVDVESRLTPEMSRAGVTWDSFLKSGECVLKELAMRHGLKADLVVRDGPAADEIVAVADDYGADLIVMGTHGRGRLGTFLLGSTAEAVVRAAKCPVLTVAHDPAVTKDMRRPQTQSEVCGQRRAQAVPQMQH